MKTNTLYRFGPVWGASGVQNFHGQGWPYHALFKKYLGESFTFKGLTFVAKTTTLHRREGNMPLDEGYMPVEKWPKCIKILPFMWCRGAALNAVGLSGPGAEALFECSAPSWLSKREPFFLSFMSTESDPEKRWEEFWAFVEMFIQYLPRFSGLVGLQHNVSCPNVGMGKQNLVREIELNANIMNQYAPEVPYIVKISAQTPVEEMLEASQCIDGICVSNTLPWAALSLSTRLLYTGRVRSPLRKYGGGGLSGAGCLRRKTLSWIQQFRQHNRELYINGGGGILRRSHVRDFHDVGADSVSLGSVAFLRPWRMRDLIEEAQITFSQKERRGT